MTGPVLLGLDFDNTVISYDQVFFDSARKRDLVPPSLDPTKTAVRDHLRIMGREDEWTMLQGEVYGPGIGAAIPFPGVLDAIMRVVDSGVRVCIVSHKTQTPYSGERHDLRHAALGWLEAHGFFEVGRLAGGPADVHFGSTMMEKVNRIVDLGCSHYVDDLAEVLYRLPDDLTRILFAPLGDDVADGPWSTLRAWDELDTLLT